MQVLVNIMVVIILQLANVLDQQIYLLCILNLQDAIGQLHLNKTRRKEIVYLTNLLLLKNSPSTLLIN